MANYLTTKAIFKCSSCPGMKIMAEMSNEKLTYQNNTVLTQNSTLKMQINPNKQCAILSLSGTPVSCKLPTLSCMQLSGFDPHCVTSGSRFLTDKAMGFCPFGGVISVSSYQDTNNRFLQGSAFFGTDTEKVDSETMSRAVRSESSPMRVAPRDSVEHAHDQGLQEELAEADNVPDPGDSSALRCGKCRERESCETRKKLSGIAFQNDSAVLRDNYIRRIEGRQEPLPAWVTEPVADSGGAAPDSVVVHLPPSPHLHKGHKAHLAYLAAENARQEYERTHNGNRGWGYEAHHILSGNEVVRPVQDILALVKALGYDINNADNCMMLPALNRSKDSNIKLGSMDETDKHIHKFRIMTLSRLQWHGSQHGKYGGKPFPEKIVARIREGMRMRKCEGLPIDYYAELLKSRLDDVVQKYKDDPVCPRDDYERRQQFYKTMNELAEEVRQKLTRFSEKPHRSAPWFVSMEAWIYAFNLPRSSRLVVVTPAPDGMLRLEKFRLTRFADTLAENTQETFLEKRHKSLTIEPYQNAMPNQNENTSILWYPCLDNIQQCINFCGNIIFFAFAPDLSNNCLGFNVPDSRIFRLKTHFALAESALPELEERQSELLVWIWKREEMGEDPECRSKIARKREAMNFFANRER